MYACVRDWVCACVSGIWDSCRKGVGGCSLFSCGAGKKGACPCMRLAQWADSSVSDITTSYLTYLKWPWRHRCLFHSVSLFLAPSSLSYTTPLPRPLSLLILSLLSFQRLLFFSHLLLLIFFFLSYIHTQIHRNRVKYEREAGRQRERERAKSQNYLPITQFFQIKAISMNINVLERSTGPGDMTKREASTIWTERPRGIKKIERFSAELDGVLHLDMYKKVQYSQLHPVSLHMHCRLSLHNKSMMYSYTWAGMQSSATSGSENMKVIPNTGPGVHCCWNNGHISNFLIDETTKST